MSASRPNRVDRSDHPHASADRPPVAVVGRRSSAERRRRERHLRRRRRDLLADTAFALVLTIMLISVTAGLGVLALLEVPIAGLVAISLVAERGLHRRAAASVALSLRGSAVVVMVVKDRRA